MLKKITAGATALALLGTVVLATTPASAQRWRGHHHHGWHGGHHGWNGGAVLGGLAAGALIGGAIASSRPTYYYPAPAYSEPVYADDDAYCSQRFRSYDPASGTYLGYDGKRHACP